VTALESEARTGNVWLDGGYRPLSEEITTYDLKVTGRLPEDLNGRLVYIGPNPAVIPDEPATYQWFDWFTGTGMVHGVRLREGRAEWYRNRFTRSDRVTESRGWPTAPGPRHGTTDNTSSTHVISLNGRTFSLCEAGALPFLLSYELETQSRSDFDGTLDGGFTSHPTADPETGELHAISYFWRWDHVRYMVVCTDGHVRRTVDIPARHGPMVHSIGLTPHYVVVMDLPVTFDKELAVRRPTFPYAWNPRHPARVGLLPREGTAESIQWFEVGDCWVFHPVNAYELPDGRVVMDVVRYDHLFMKGPVDPIDASRPTMDRWTIDPATGRLAEERLDDRPQEFPRTDQRLVGRPYRYTYVDSLVGSQFGGMYKHDVVAGTSEYVDFGPGRATTEVQFVPRTPDSAEDDGWLLSYVYDAATDRSEVAVLHAQDLAAGPVATIHLPQRVTWGFHSNWLPDD
jgi:carotenoid cleavage dioxygenase-like enzyme